MRASSAHRNVPPPVPVVVVALTVAALGACGPAAGEDEPVNEQALAFNETTCATNASNVDATFVVNPPSCGDLLTSDSVTATYGHSDCTKGWVTELTSTYGERIVVTNPTWVGGAITNETVCVGSYMVVKVWGQHLLGGWESPSTSTYTGSWVSSQCIFERVSGPPPFNTTSSMYGKIKLVNTAGFVFGPTVRAKQTVIVGNTC